MYHQFLSLLAAVTCAGIINSCAETIGRNVDPNFSNYLDNRSCDQKAEDEKQLEANKNKKAARRENEAAIRAFNERVKDKEPANSILHDSLQTDAPLNK